MPHSRTDNGGRNDRGAWADPPPAVEEAWAPLAPAFDFRELAFLPLRLDVQADEKGSCMVRIGS